MLKIYTSKNCSFSQGVLRLLQIKNIPYKEVKRHGKDTPTLEQNGKEYTCYNACYFDALAFIEGRYGDMSGERGIGGSGLKDNVETRDTLF